MGKSRGFRSQTRKLLRKRRKSVGFAARLLKVRDMAPGQKVVVYIDPSFHKGMPHRRYHGKIGTVVGRRGRAYEVETRKGDKRVLLVVPPQHLRKY
ncbi:MAG: 50S ribosomal protein L21e [Candidatus Geothermarchaeales archaeon]